MGAYAGSPAAERHAELAATFAAEIPGNAAVSATSALFPRVSRREQVYVFPAVADADFVFLDVIASSAPTSTGDVFARVQRLLHDGDWTVQRAEDGLLLLRHNQGGDPVGIDEIPDSFYSFTRIPPAFGEAGTDETRRPLQSYLDGAVDLVDAEFRPQPSGALAPREPRAALRTTWRANRHLTLEESPVFRFEVDNGRTESHTDLAALAWHPPHRWAPGELVRVEVLNIPLGGRWWVDFETSAHSPSL
jgi:hypothetical protein